MLLKFGYHYGKKHGRAKGRAKYSLPLRRYLTIGFCHGTSKEMHAAESSEHHQGPCRCAI